MGAVDAGDPAPPALEAAPVPAVSGLPATLYLPLLLAPAPEPPLPLALAPGQPGKEILYPVATVIIGGLISSTLLDFVVRPALFARFGQGAAERVADAHSHARLLDLYGCDSPQDETTGQ